MQTVEKSHNPLLGDVDEFVENNKGLVYKFVRQYMRKTNIKVEYEDVLQEGMVGLVKAYRMFDGRGEFSTFAFFHIRNQVRNYYRGKSALIRVAAHIYELIGKIHKQNLQNEDPEIIVQTFGCSMDSAVQALQQIKNPRNHHSLNYKVKNGDSEIEILDSLGSEGDFSSAIVKEFFDTLTEREKMILSYLALGYLQREIAPIVGYSRQWVQRHAAGIRSKARDYFGVAN